MYLWHRLFLLRALHLTLLEALSQNGSNASNATVEFWLSTGNTTCSAQGSNLGDVQSKDVCYGAAANALGISSAPTFEVSSPDYAFGCYFVLTDGSLGFNNYSNGSGVDALKRYICMQAKIEASCASFSCLAPTVARNSSLNLTCQNGCTKEWCCVSPLTCQNFSCSAPSVLRSTPENLLCHSACTQGLCCKPPTTTTTTTTPLTCVNFICLAPMSLRSLPGSLNCVSVCTIQLCCTQPPTTSTTVTTTTTFQTTTTTTLLLTCANFSCPVHWFLRSTPENLKCTPTCVNQLCCTQHSTTSVSTTTKSMAKVVIVPTTTTTTTTTSLAQTTTTTSFVPLCGSLSCLYSAELNRTTFFRKRIASFQTSWISFGVLGFVLLLVGGVVATSIYPQVRSWPGFSSRPQYNVVASEDFLSDAEGPME